MEILSSKLTYIKCCFLSFISTNLFYYEKNKHSIYISMDDKELIIKTE